MTTAGRKLILALIAVALLASLAVATVLLLMPHRVLAKGRPNYTSPSGITIIRQIGVYRSADGKFTATIDIDVNNLVAYYISDAAGTGWLAMGKAGNAYMNYSMCWDKNDNFWIDGQNTSLVLLCRGQSFETHYRAAADSQPDSKIPRPPTDFANSN